MSIILNCSHDEDVQPYIGVDSTCNKSAIFCIHHGAHKSKQGLLHQMMPLSQFRRTINQKKFKMGDKVAGLIEQYSNFMDELIKEITELKLRKIVQLSMLWLRELASNEQQYQNLRKLYRNDYEGLTCKDIHWLYFKIGNNQKLQTQKLQEIQCYKDICKVMFTLQQSVKARLMISEKVMELQGVVQKGQLLRRALPDRRILKENTKQILMQVLNSKVFQVKYNKITLKENTRNFQSIFSKYPLIEHTNYHLFILSKYSNILLGICDEQLKNSPTDINDLHYSQSSITFNCSNGCLYRDGMFESGSASLTKGQKELQLILRVTDMEILILLGKNVVCRVGIEAFKKEKVFLHLLMRTEGDSIQIDRDKFVILTGEQGTIKPTKQQFSDIIQEQVQEDSYPKISIDNVLMTKQNVEQEFITPTEKLVRQNFKRRSDPTSIGVTPMIESQFHKRKDELNPKKYSINLMNSIALKKSGQRQKTSMKDSNPLPSDQRSKVLIEMQQSLAVSDPDQASSRYASNVYDRIAQQGQDYHQQKGMLLNPVVMHPLQKSQFQSLRSSAYDNSLYANTPMPSAKILQKKASELTNTINDIKITHNQVDYEWI